MDGDEGDEHVLWLQTGPYLDCQLHFKCGLRFGLFSRYLRDGVEQGARLTHREFQCMLVFDRAYPEGALLETFLKEVWENHSRAKKSFDTQLVSLRRKLEPLGFEIRYGVNLYTLATRRPRYGGIDESALPPTTSS